MLETKKKDQFLIDPRNIDIIKKDRRRSNTNRNATVMGKTILEQAQSIVYGDRQDAYGNVTDNFSNIAKLWSVVIGKDITAEQVALCMVQVKVARQLHKPGRDNLVDGAGYFATIEKMQNEQEDGKI